jgi:hypothetical protein
MTNDALVPIEILLPAKAELHRRILSLSPDLMPQPGEVGDALGWSLLFEHWPDLVSPPISREEAFYNHYFWMSRFATLKQRRDGYDAGLEQQVFQVLERADFDVDWGLVEQIHNEAAA